MRSRSLRRRSRPLPSSYSQGLFASSRPTFTHAYCTPTVGCVSFRYLSPAPSAEPALSTAEYFSRETATPKLDSLEDGAISSGTIRLAATHGRTRPGEDNKLTAACCGPRICHGRAGDRASPHADPGPGPGARKADVVTGVTGRAADGGAARGALDDAHAGAAGGDGEGERAQGCGLIDAAASRKH